MNYGAFLRSSATGEPVIFTDDKNLRIKGPYIGVYGLSHLGNYYCNFTSNLIAPIVYIKLPAYGSSNGAAITTVRHNGGTSFTAYIFYRGAGVPLIKVTDDFSGVIEDSYGMSVYDTNGLLIWNSAEILHIGKQINWSPIPTATSNGNTLFKQPAVSPLISNFSHVGDMYINTTAYMELAIFYIDFFTNITHQWYFYPIFSNYLGYYIYSFPITVYSQNNDTPTTLYAFHEVIPNLSLTVYFPAPASATIQHNLLILG